MQKIKIIFTVIVCLFAIVARAETVYVSDELKIGLHKSAKINSPIVKLVPSGTELSVIERGNKLVKVKEPSGAEGWIDNTYLVNKKPSNKSEEQKNLAQQLKSERLKSGQLQADLADLKTKIANVANVDQLLSEIDQLKQENDQLKMQLKSSGIDIQTNSGITSDSFVALHGLKQYLSVFIIILVIGMASGAFILDFLNRRRHGGFRI